MLRRFLRDERGLTTIEYGLLICFLGVWCVIALESAGMLPLAR